MNEILMTFLYIIYRLLGIVSWVLFIKIIVDVLVMGRLIPYNDMVGKIMNVLHNLTEPILGRIRSVLPPAPIDISYIVAIFGIMILRWIIASIIS